MHFGLSRQEATVYLRLLEAGKHTGYEIARDTGISRSNAYASLAAMVKGAAYLVEEDAKRYIPVHCSGVCGNRIPEWKKNRNGSAESYARTEEEGYITIEGQRIYFR